jgi:AcrR family transcriptional regulator
MAAETAAAETFTERQSAVLQSALTLLVEGGEKALTTAGLARAANCSKESLYKWFGDRDGLLAAVIGFQAAKVRTLPAGSEPRSAEAFRAELVTFAEDLLTVLAGETSLALNRLAIGQASREGAHLGRLLLERGRRSIDTRATRLIEAGRRLGHLAFDDAGETYRSFYGLVVRDLHVRLLLGEPAGVELSGFRARAEEAVAQFYRLFGAGKASGEISRG